MARRVLVGSLAVLALAAMAGWYAYSVWPSSYRYIIPGVPLTDIYESQSLTSNLTSSFRAGLFAILGYWGDAHAAASSTPYRFISSGLIDVDQLRAYLDSQGFTMQAVYLTTSTDLEKYINPTNPTPLLFRQVFSLNHLDLEEYQVLVGLDLKQNDVLINSFTRGPLYQIPLAEYQQLWDVEDIGSRYRFFVIVPKDPTAVAQRVMENKTAAPYPPRTAVMNNFALLYQYLDILEAPRDAAWSGALAALTNDPNFSELHPIIRMRVYLQLALEAMNGSLYPQALQYLQKAMALNHNLNDPFPGWGAPAYSEDPFPVRALARYYKAIGDKTNATATFAQYRGIYEAQFGMTAPD